jgi:hypothetical protein
LNIQDINAALNRRSREDVVRRANAYLAGDSWQDGRGFSLQFLSRKDIRKDQTLEEFWALVKDNTKEVFAPLDLLRECTQRHRDAVIGKEPLWKFVRRSGEEDEFIASELEPAATAWWNDLHVFLEFQQATPPLLYDTWSDGRSHSVMRFYIPPGEFADGTSDGSTLRDVMPNIRLMHIPAGAGYVQRDEYGREFWGTYAYQRNRKDYREVSILRKDISDDFIAQLPAAMLEQLGEPEPDDTVVLNARIDGTVEAVNVFRLGGRLTIFDLHREPLIVPTTITFQKHIDTVNTMIMTGVPSGLPERVLGNAQPHGYFRDPKDHASRSYVPTDTHTEFVAEPWRIGYGDVNVITGMNTYDSEGPSGYTTPFYQRLGVIDAKPLRETLEFYEARFYKAMKQAHVLIQGDATASGTSREQATSDFDASLALTASSLQYGIMNALETLLAFCDHYLKGGLAERYRAEVQTVKRSSIPTPEQRKQTVAEGQAGYRSREGVMSLIGIEDTGAEMQRIEEEKKQKAETGGEEDDDDGGNPPPNQEGTS